MPKICNTKRAFLSILEKKLSETSIYVSKTTLCTQKLIFHSEQKTFFGKFFLEYKSWFFQNKKSFWCNFETTSLNKVYWQRHWTANRNTCQSTPPDAIQLSENEIIFRLSGYSAPWYATVPRRDSERDPSQVEIWTIKGTLLVLCHGAEYPVSRNIISFSDSLNINLFPDSQIFLFPLIAVENYNKHIIKY